MRVSTASRSSARTSGLKFSASRSGLSCKVARVNWVNVPNSRSGFASMKYRSAESTSLWV